MNENMMKSETPIDRNVITMIKTQKHSKDIGEIVHVTSEVQL